MNQTHVPDKIYMLALFHGLNLQDIKTFLDVEACRASFQEATGIKYDDYARRMQNGEEGNADILDEDEEGTEIFVLDFADGLMKSPQVGWGGVALWAI